MMKRIVFIKRSKEKVFKTSSVSFRCFQASAVTIEESIPPFEKLNVGISLVVATFVPFHNKLPEPPPIARPEA